MLRLINFQNKRQCWNRLRTISSAPPSTFTHIAEDGRIQMVDVSKKQATQRVGKASGKVTVDPKVIDQLKNSPSMSLMKGPVFRTAELAGIMAAKRTSELIPLCHNLNLADVQVQCRLDEETNSILINSTITCCSQTGVEMEALTAVSVAALTIYDMCKSVTKSAVIHGIQLDFKSGGKSGEYQRDSINQTIMTK